MITVNNVNVYTVDEFPWEAVADMQPLTPPKGWTRRKRDGHIRYMPALAAFDIETSRISESSVDQRSIMYIWQMYIEGVGAIIGRTWPEWLDAIHQLDDNLNGTMLCYVHNLSYEWAYIWSVTPINPEDVFAIGPRQPLRVNITPHIEFRCSAKLADSGLEAFTEGLPHAKAVGDIDHHIMRRPWTELTDAEMGYVINDVVGLVEAVRRRMEQEADTPYTIPLTSTGYIRREVKEALNRDTSWNIRPLIPSYHFYRRLRAAFRGGNTHANRHYVGEICTDCNSFDRTSSYPHVMVYHDFPMTPFRKCPPPEDHEMIERWVNMRKRALLMHVVIENCKLKCPEKTSVPYLAAYLCSYTGNRYPAGHQPEIHVQLDNGRIMAADRVGMWITDIDYFIIRDQYEGEYSIDECWYSAYKPLPGTFRNLILKLFEDKTKLKHVDDEKYMRSKRLINSAFGMAAQDPGKEGVLWKPERGCWVPDPRADHEQYNENARLALPYQVGVWVTAWARYELQTAIDEIEADPNCEFLYCDTDSVKFMGRHDFTALNERFKNCYTAESPEDGPQTLGKWDQEPHMQRFITLGAKNYAYESDDNKLHITIAGVVKKNGAKELEKLGGLEAMADVVQYGRTLVFTEAGGNDVVYCDDAAHEEYIDDRPVIVGSSATIVPSKYTLSMNPRYLDIIQRPDLIWKLIHEPDMIDYFFPEGVDNDPIF